jgi:hypothetical protein
MKEMHEVVAYFEKHDPEGEGWEMPLTMRDWLLEKMNFYSDRVGWNGTPILRSARVEKDLEAYLNKSGERVHYRFEVIRLNNPAHYWVKMRNIRKVEGRTGLLDI